MVAFEAEGHKSRKKSKYYTEEKIGAAKKNISRYDWARNRMVRAIKRADQIIASGSERIWEIPTTQKLPRSYAVNQEKGCPVCGTGLYTTYGQYGWILNHFNAPWKIKCPNCKFIFPSNDFESYCRSGIDVNGNFEPSIADKAYLKNILYPDKPENWMVDDGYGWVTENGDRFVFTAYYNMFGIWFSERSAISFLLDLKDAYLLTGLKKYAHAGLILLDRIADVYPDLDTSVYRIKDGFRMCDGLSGKGKMTGSIWDAMIVWDLVCAYDAFYPELSEEGGKYIEFLKEKASRYHLCNRKATAESIMENIENRIIGCVFDDVLTGKIRGNTGLHQSALAIAAVLTDDRKAGKYWLDWIFRSAGIVKNGDTINRGGNIQNALVSDVDRDGFGNESGPGYNQVWADNIYKLAGALEACDYQAEHDLYRNPRFAKLLAPEYQLNMCSKFTPPIGDSGVTGAPGIMVSYPRLVKRYLKYREPHIARIIDYLFGSRPIENAAPDIFVDYEKLEESIKKDLGRYGKLKCLESSNLTGYGFTALRDGEKNGQNDSQRGMWIYYGRNYTAHSHSDTLNIDIYAYGMDLAPDLGYPEYTADCPDREEWTNNTISHNTVVVNCRRQDHSFVGIPYHFEDSKLIKLTDVEAPFAYCDTKLYRRSVIMVNVDSENAYYIDIFRVRGGYDHHYSFHAAEGEAAVNGAHLVKQQGGTYAGAGVSYMHAYDRVPGELYNGSGFHYLNHVERCDKPHEGFSVDWRIKDTWGVHKEEQDIHLRLTMLCSVDDIALADGQPPRNKPGNPEKLRYFIAHMNGKNLESKFVTLIEPYKESRKIQYAQRVEIMAEDGADCSFSSAAVKVGLKGGRTDYIINTLDPDKKYIIDGRIELKGAFAVYSEAGRPLTGFVSDGSLLRVDGIDLIKKELSCVKGRLFDFTKDLSFENYLTVSFETEGFDISMLTGRYLYIENDKKRNAVYLIKAVKEAEDGTFILDIGDASMVRGFANVNDFSEGYIYDVSSGAAITVPLEWTWKCI